jgi:hypothetical protein
MLPVIVQVADDGLGLVSEREWELGLVGHGLCGRDERGEQCPLSIVEVALSTLGLPYQECPPKMCARHSFMCARHSFWKGYLPADFAGFPLLTHFRTTSFYTSWFV